MKRRKVIIYFFILAGLVAVATSCSDNFLELTNQNELTADNFYTKIENFDLSLNATYDAVKNLDLFGQTFYVQTLLALPHESDYWNAQNRNEVTSIDGNVYIAWRGFFRIVARANDIIGNAPAFEASGKATPDQLTQLKKIVGQAHFLRGLAYFHMVRL